MQSEVRVDVVKLVLIVLGVGTAIAVSYVVQRWSGWRRRILQVAPTTFLVQAPRLGISGVAITVGIRFLFKVGGKQENFPDSIKLLLGIVLIIGGCMTIAAILLKTLPFLVGGLGILVLSFLVTGVAIILVAPTLDGVVLAVVALLAAAITGIDRFLVNSVDLLVKEVVQMAGKVEQLAEAGEQPTEEDHHEKDE